MASASPIYYHQLRDLFYRILENVPDIYKIAYDDMSFFLKIWLNDKTLCRNPQIHPATERCKYQCCYVVI